MEYRISTKLSIYLKYLHKEGNIGIRELWRRYLSFSLSTIQRQATSDINVNIENGSKKQGNKRGRKKIIGARGERSLLRALRKNRENGMAFTSKRLQVQSGLTYTSN